MTDPAGLGGERETTILHIAGLTEAIGLYDQLYGDLLELEPILHDAAWTMGTAVRTRIHSDTYRLAASITPIATGASAEVVSGSVYAAVQQWGWPAMNIPAQRFVTRAIAEEWPAVQRDAEAAVQALVDALGMGES